MSSEYIYDRRAVLLSGTDCNYIALFILSHSNNVDPHEPHWSLYGLSKQCDALNIPLKYAHYCDSGITRGVRGRSITGEYDITKWRQAIAAVRNVSFKLNIRFYEKPVWTELGQPLFKKLSALASQRNIALTVEAGTDVFRGESRPYESLTLDLAKPSDVDLIWQSTRDGTDPEAVDHHKRMVLPGNLLRRDYFAFGLDTFAKAQTLLVPKLIPSTWKLNEKILKFAFPVNGQATYMDERYVVVDWRGRVISTSPEYWFCEHVLPKAEAAEPGSAESAYKKFKAIKKSLHVTPHEGMTIEVPATMKTEQLSKLENWQQENRQAFFARLLKPGFPAAYTDCVDDHIKALSMSDFMECNLALSTQAAMQEGQLLFQETDQLSLLS